MNITSLEIAQATMDMFFCLFCLIIFVSIKANNPKQKSMRMFVRLFLIATVLFFGETLAYIFRGNLGPFNILVTRIANLMVFAMNIAMANTYVRYVSSVFVEKGAEVSGNSVKIANIFSCINIFIVVVNLFYPWMYYFDEANYYHRNNFWYVYTLISLVVIFIGAGIAFKYRKYLEKRSFISMMLFSFIPIIATVVQSFIYGFSITNLGLGIGSFVMFAAYMYDWSHNGDEHTNMINNSRFDAVIMLIIMLLSMSVSIIACVNGIQQVTKENSEIQSRTIAQMVSAKIEKEFIKPITVSQTISSDIDIRTYIEGKTREEAESVKDDMTNRLVSIGNEFDYKMVFVVSDKTRAYYTYNGISRYLDVENDSHDIWYKDYLDSGKRYIVNVDTDEDNNGSLTVFINYGIFDTNGDILGVCGVGVDMNDLVDILARFEEEYNIKVDLVNHDGLIQVDTDVSSIETSYLDNSYFGNVSDDDFYYQLSENGCYMTKYLEGFDGYIVIRDKNPVKLDVNKIILPIVLIFVAGVLIMATSFVIISMREKKAKDAYNRRYEASIKDNLTGLYNRRGFEDDCEIIKKNNNLIEYVLIMMDLNGLKEVNDNIGHEAGDELIIGASKCMDNAFSGLGRTYRVGGDEFVALLRGTREEAQDAVKTFDYLTENYQGNLISELSVSKGVVVCSEHIELNFEEIKAMADKLMYADKDEYYRRTGKDRRRV